jgi:heptosyltransferase I
LSAHTEANPNIEKLLIVRLSAMGDVIHTLPAAQALRDAFPNAMMGWLIEERWADLLCAPGTARRGPRSAQRPLVDWVHTVRLREWKKSLASIQTLELIARAWNDVRSVGYDIAVDLQGAIRSAVLARWSGARVIYGTIEPRESPASLWYSRTASPRGTHVIEQNLSLAEAIVHKRLSAQQVDLPRDAQAERRIEQRLAEIGFDAFAILNPGAGWGAKQWPVERYGRVASALGAHGVRCILNYGPGEEKLAREAESASEGAARAIECSISELIALTRRARLFVGGDTGPMHLAAALQVPVVAIFGPTDPARNGPFGTRSIVLRNPQSTTSHARRVQPEQGMLEIGVQVVVEAAAKLLAERGQECPRHTGGAHG